MDPWFVTGFTDGEGCFNITISKDNQQKIGWAVKLAFTIGLNEKDINLLKKIQLKFNVGNIYKYGSNLFQLRVVSIKNLTKIIDHFNKFPLITQKHADYELFKQAFQLMEEGEHLTLDGLNKIVAIKASMNRGLSEKLKFAFPDVVPAVRPFPPRGEPTPRGVGTSKKSGGPPYTDY